MNYNCFCLSNLVDIGCFHDWILQTEAQYELYLQIQFQLIHANLRKKKSM